MNRLAAISISTAEALMAGQAEIRRWPGEKSKIWLEGLLASASTEPTLLAIVALGSAIRPRGHRRSDLDILVVYSGKKPSLRPPMGVDARLYEIGSLPEKAAAGDEVLGWALRLGRSLHDPTGVWERLRTRWSAGLPLPSATEAFKRSAQCEERAFELLSLEDEDAASDLALAAITQLARAKLLEKKIFPASRPELPFQLREIGENELAQLLDAALDTEEPVSDLLHRLSGLRRRPALP